MRKKILCYCSFLSIVFSMGFNSVSVNAESIIPAEKPLIINEESNVSGGLNSGTKNPESISGGIISGDTNHSFTEEYAGEGLMTPDDILGNTDVSIADFENIIVSRLLDVVGLFQKVSKPLCIIFFILSALLVVVSIVFGTKNVKAGFLGMMLSILAYVGTMYAPDLVLFFSQWLSV